MDFASYSSTAGLNLQAIWMLGDLDGDFDVDDFDMDILGDNLGISNPSHEDGDLDEDGDVDNDDLDLMFAQYGLELTVAS